MIGGDGLPAVFHQTLADPEMSCGVVGVIFEIGRIRIDGVGIAMGFAQLVRQAEPRTAKRRVALERFAVVTLHGRWARGRASVDLGAPEERPRILGEVVRPAVEDLGRSAEVVGFEIHACQCLVKLKVRLGTRVKGAPQRGLRRAMLAGLGGNQGLQET